jgi:hypothetical protein
VPIRTRAIAAKRKAELGKSRRKTHVSPALRASPRTLLPSPCLVSLSSQPFFLPRLSLPPFCSVSHRSQEETFGADHYPGPGVPSAISSALKPLQLQTPTVPSPLFRPPSSSILPAPHPPSDPLRLASSPRRSFSTLSLIFPPRYVAARRSPFTFAHCSRKGNFVTRAGSSSPRQGSVLLHSGEITCRSAPQARKKISLIKRRFLPPSGADARLRSRQSSVHADRRARAQGKRASPGSGIGDGLLIPRKQRPPRGTGVSGMKNACG